MRKVVVSEFVSLDGVFEDPSWTFPFRSGAVVLTCQPAPGGGPARPSGDG